jgi:Asp-tRNA(Asn)/Glu-tRNA(Gln) amidotransferase A subunit family amidase
MTYDLKPMKAPRAAGNTLRALVAAMENPATGALLAGKLLGDAGITALRKLRMHGGPDARHPVFGHGQPLASAESVDLDALVAALPPFEQAGHAPETSADFVSAYREGRSDPVAVAERACAIISESERHSPALRLLIAHQRSDLMKQAEASAERYRQGATLGPLDGVPVAVKDELDQAPYPTTVGTKFLGREPARADAEVVARLRRAGALLIGKANMHEIGIGVTGLNPHHGAVRNPYDTARATGGSSSGSAAAVAAGLCPMAVAADGGGSVRIPAALCGQVGLKATYGRISEHGAAELCWSVAHIGPIATNVRDTALAYAVMAGVDEKDPNSVLQPQPRFDDIADGALEGIRIGVYQHWFEDAEPRVVERCYDALDALKAAGAVVCDVVIPELEVARVAHLITIVTEMATAHMQYYAEHRRDYGLDTRISLALARRLQGYDYVQAQRQRTRIWRHFDEALRDVDVIATPTTGCTAPILPLDALQTGESNLEVTGEIMRFAAPGNLTGLPAISVPAGYDDKALPIGLQLMGRAWEEQLLLRLAAVVERSVKRQAPRISYRYLG